MFFGKGSGKDTGGPSCVKNIMHVKSGCLHFITKAGFSVFPEGQEPMVNFFRLPFEAVQVSQK